MSFSVIHTDASDNFLEFLKEIQAQPTAAWRLATIKTDYLIAMTPSATAQALAPIFCDATRTALYFMDNGDIFAIWQGPSQEIAAGISLWVGANLRPVGIVPIETIVSYSDPRVTALALASEISDARAPKSRPTPSLRALDDKRREHFEAMCKARQTRKRPLALIVEDVEFSRKLLESVLQHEFDTIGALDAHDGWELFIERVPDIVLLDIEMPGISGHELAGRIKQMPASTFVVMVSGHKSMADIDRARSNGISAFIIKPYSKQKIEECIGRVRSYLKTRHTSQT